MSSEPMSPSELVEQVLGWVHRLARRAARLHGLDAEDLAQEIFLRILRKAPLYDPERSAPTTWATFRSGMCWIRRSDYFIREYFEREFGEPTGAGKPMISFEACRSSALKISKLGIWIRR